MRPTPSLFAIVNTPLYSSNNSLSLCLFFAIVMPNSSRSNAGSCSGDAGCVDGGYTWQVDSWTFIGDSSLTRLVLSSTQNRYTVLFARRTILAPSETSKRTSLSLKGENYRS